jgi:hypothetical protein
MKTIALSNSDKVALVDDDTYDRLSGHGWYLLKGKYAAANVRRDGKRILALMHREVVAAPVGSCVDHINGAGLDNRRANLRLVTQAQNTHNRRRMPVKANRAPDTPTTKYKGVIWLRSASPNTRKRWMARLRTKGQSHFLGCYPTDAEAARAYDAAARQHFGEFAHLNFPAAV